MYGTDVSNVVLGNVVDCAPVIWTEVGIPRHVQEGYMIEQLRSTHINMGLFKNNMLKIKK